MAKGFAFLDAGPLRLACRHSRFPGAEGIRLKFLLWQEKDISVVIPEITDYEVRRELIRRILSRQDSPDSLRRLDDLRRKLTFVPIRTEAMQLAAELWARARNSGDQTADDTSLDGDVILAAQARAYTGLGDNPVIITDNQRHLNRYDVVTSSWEAYSPSPPPTP